MWLINTGTLELEFFSDATAVDYVILSHTWAEGEITFGDMSDKSAARKKQGWPKIEMTCQLARVVVPLVSYVWVDTCCIDKTSSAELSEAINSMFAWYKASALCLVHLADLEIKPGQGANGIIESKLPQCRWFSRGWTLQELIAPRHVYFCNSSWEVIGAKDSLCGLLRQITGIDTRVLEDSSCLAAVPVGRRLSWAALRSTTRVEDVAYSLLGVFDVNMPLLYGEGNKAFIRLQEEIARSTNDLSLLAWKQPEAEEFRFRGIFAQSPREFLCCHHVKSPIERLRLPTEFSLTNRGLRIEDNLKPQGLQELDRTNDGLVLGLDCIESSPQTHFTPKWLGIYLWKHGSTYVRWSPGRFFYSPSRKPWTSSPAAKPAYITTVLSLEYVQTMHVQTKILIVTNHLNPGPSGHTIERVVNTRGSFVSFQIFPIDTNSGKSKSNPSMTTNVAVLYGIQDDLATKPEDREPWAMLYMQGQALEASSNDIDDIFLTGDSALRGSEASSIVQDFAFANFSDDGGFLQDAKMPKHVDIPDSARPSKIYRVSLSVEPERTVLRFGRTAFNRTFKVILTVGV